MTDTPTTPPADDTPHLTAFRSLVAGLPDGAHTVTLTVTINGGTASAARDLILPLTGEQIEYQAGELLGYARTEAAHLGFISPPVSDLDDTATYSASAVPTATLADAEKAAEPVAPVADATTPDDAPDTEVAP